MKQLIVLNLNAKRIIILFGSFFSLFGFVLWLGIQSGVRAQKKRELDFNLANRAPVEDSSVKLLKQEENGAVFELIPDKTNSKPVLEPLKATDFGASSNIDIPVVADPMASSISSSGANNLNDYYTIQIAAFSKQADALRLVRDLQNKNIDAFIDRGVRYWYVRSGKSESKSNLQALASQIRSADYETLIIRQSN